MEAVSNTTVLLLLAKIGRLDLLQNLFSKVFLPPTVREELFARAAQHEAECAALRVLIGTFLKIQQPTTPLDCGLDRGEAEALSLCEVLQVKHFLSDDAAARTFAHTLGLVPMGVIGILLANHHAGNIQSDEYRALLNKVIEAGLYVSAELYQAAQDAVK